MVVLLIVASGFQQKATPLSEASCNVVPGQTAVSLLKMMLDCVTKTGIVLMAESAQPPPFPTTNFTI